MLRRSISLLETGFVAGWGKGKPFGFISLEGQEDKRIFVHQSAIIQASGQRPIQNIRRGVKVQFDITKDSEGRDCAKNVTSVGGSTLSRRDEIPTTTVDVRSLRDRLVDEEDDSRHAAALRGIVQSINTISTMQRRTDTVNRNILRLMNAILEKEGLKEIPSGEKYVELKQKVLANVIQDAEERKALREARKAKGEASDDDDDDEEILDEKKKH